MPKQIISDTFETLGQAAKQVVGQIAQEPVKMAETAAGQTIKPSESSIEQPQSQQGATPAQQAQKKAATVQKLTYLEQELQALQQKKAQEPPKQITGQLGFSEEKLIKQIEMEKEKKEEPLVVRLARQKTGTGERKRMGVSG